MLDADRVLELDQMLFVASTSSARTRSGHYAPMASTT
jgi:hypothetical protein